MDNNESVHASALDNAISSNNIHILKTAIPFVTVEKQRYISVYVKYLELMNTISFFNNNKSNHGLGDATIANLDLFDLLAEIKPFLARKDQELVDSFMNMANLMKMYDSYKDMFTSEGGESFSTNPFDSLKNMLTPEQQAMFDMYQNML